MSFAVTAVVGANLSQLCCGNLNTVQLWPSTVSLANPFVPPCADIGQRRGRPDRARQPVLELITPSTPDRLPRVVEATRTHWEAKQRTPFTPSRAWSLELPSSVVPSDFLCMPRVG